MAVEYPVALDSDYAIWRAFDNQLLAGGSTSPMHEGESGTIASARADTTSAKGHPAVARGGRTRRPSATSWSPLPHDGFEAQADWANLGSPETYLGYEQAENFASPGGVSPDEARVYATPDGLDAQPLVARGRLDGRGRAAVLNRGRRADLVSLSRARRASRHGPAGTRTSCRSGCSSTETLRAPLTVSTSTRMAAAPSRTAALPADPPAGTDRRPDVRDRVPRSRRRGLRVHLRLGRTSDGAIYWAAKPG